MSIKIICISFFGGFLAIGLIAARVAMLDLDVAVIHQGGECVAVSQHPGGGSHPFGAPDAAGKCWLGWRLLYEHKD